MAERPIRVEVVAALPQRQILISLEVPAGTTLLEAVDRSAIAHQLPGLEIDPQRLGVFGRIRPPETRLRDGDRAEVYRRLNADPKEVRRQLAELERSRRKN